MLTASAATALVIYAARHTGGVLRTKPSREAQYQLAVLGGALVFTLANLLVLGAPLALGGPVSQPEVLQSFSASCSQPVCRAPPCRCTC